ncbi:hypothetical protein RCL1_004779 [Eukaryota sp. TZLM3-RCL]
MTTLDEFVTLNTFIISDTHFSHSNILSWSPKRLDNSHIPNASELSESQLGDLHDSTLATAWNSTVTNQHRVLCLGDFAWKTCERWCKELQGKKAIILGNHDKSKSFFMRRFEHVIDSPTICLNGINLEVTDSTTFKSKPTSCFIKDFEFKGKSLRIMFSHFPVFDYSNPFDPVQFPQHRLVLERLFDGFKCDLNLHGHIHDADPTDPRCINVCVEKIGIKPVTIKQVLEKYFERQNSLNLASTSEDGSGSIV